MLWYLPAEKESIDTTHLHTGRDQGWTTLNTFVPSTLFPVQIIYKSQLSNNMMFGQSQGSSLTYPVQSVNGYCLEGPPHHRILLQHLIEIVHRERVQATVGVRSHIGRPSASGQQTDLCGLKDTRQERDGSENGKLRHSRVAEKWQRRNREGKKCAVWIWNQATLIYNITLACLLLFSLSSD